MRRTLESNIWKYYLFKILSTALFAAPIIVLFYQENGLSLTEIMILQSIFSITIVFLEIPTGYFADRFGRKFSLTLGAISTTLGVIVYSIGNAFFIFVLADIFWGMGKSLISGADSAILYDTLKKLNKTHLFKKISGNALALTMIAYSIIDIIGGFIAEIDLRLTLIMSVPVVALSIPLALSIREPKITKKIISKNHLKEIIQTTKYALVKKKRVRWLILYSSLLSVATILGFWLYQPYLKSIGLGILWFGFVYAGMNVIGAFGSKFSHDIESILGEKISIILPIVLLVSGNLIMGIFGSLIMAIISIILIQFSRGFQQPIMNHYINKIIPSNRRATILSIKQIGGRLAFATFSPFIGWFADVYTLQQAILLSGLTILIMGSVLFFFMRRDKII